MSTACPGFDDRRERGYSALLLKPLTETEVIAHATR